VAFSVGDLPAEQRLAALATVARHDAGDPLVRAAIVSSAGGQEANLCARLAGDPKAAELVRALAGVVGIRNDTVGAEALQKLAVDRFKADQRAAAFSLLAAIREGQRKAHPKEPPAAANGTEEILSAAADAAKDQKLDEPTRTAAITLLATTSYPQSGAELLGLTDPHQPQTVQSAAVTALGKFADPAVGPALVKQFRELSPRLRTEALAVLLQRPDRAMALLDGIQKRALQPQDVPSPQQTFLRSHRDPQVRQLARKLLVAPTGSRDDVIKEFQPALSLTGDAAKGKLVYEQRCISCHRIGGEGSAVGPDLTTVRAAGKEKMLVNILDPNREVAPNYLAYLVETKSGDSLTGIIVNETASSLTVREAYGKETVVLRSDLKRMASQKLSLMPEGIEAGLKPQDVADLLEFLTTVK
jgi:putative heme-binding domain-containing protein